MKTSVIIYREMGSFKVEQRTKDGFFNAKSLERQWNIMNEDKPKEIRKFLELKSTKEFIETLKEQESSSGEKYSTDYQAVKHTKSRNTSKGRTPEHYWFHPLLYLDFAMWLSPTFKYHVLKFVSDKLIDFRKDSGSKYNEMSSAIFNTYNGKREFREFIPKEVSKIKRACGVEDWNHATQEQLERRLEIEKNVILLADYVPSDDLISVAIKKTLNI